LQLIGCSNTWRRSRAQVNRAGVRGRSASPADVDGLSRSAAGGGTIAARQLIDEGRLEEAWALLYSLLGRRPDYADGWISAGALHVRFGRREAAIAALREALRLQPGHPLARRNLELLETWRPPGDAPAR
jgi:Flp pilus assembly protein TadD